ncbi:MAG TPA: hypothetical protein VIL97_06205, partial [Thermoanaerobaculia bacterium]
GSHVAVGGTDATLFRIDSDGRLAVFSRVKLDTAAVDVAIDGAILYVAERDTGISVYEIGSELVTRIGSIPLPAKTIAVADGRLFAASGPFGVSIVDVANPRAARILTTATEGLADAREIVHAGDLLWIDDAGQRLVALRYDGASWSTANAIDVDAAAFAAFEGRLFIAERPAKGIESDAAFTAFDVAASGLAFAGEFRHDRGPLGGVGLVGDFAYLADPPLLRVVDLRDPHGLREVTAIPIGDASDRVRIEGSLALVYGTENVHLIDVSSPASPRWLGVFRSFGFPRSGAAMAGNTLLECNRATGFHVVDISDPSAPRQTSGLRNEGYGQFHGVVAMPGVAYAFVNAGVKVVDLSNPNSVQFVRVIRAPVVYDAEIAPANARRAALLLLLDGDLLRVFDLRDPLVPSEIARIEVPTANDIAVDGETAVVTTPHGALLIIDLADPARPQIRRVLAGLSSPSQVAVRGGRIAVADRFALRLLRDPDVPLPGDEVTLKVRSDSTSRLAHLSWTSIPDATYEVQLSETNDFANARSIVTGRSQYAFSLSRTTSVRVRVADACTAGVWSNAVRVAPDEMSAVDFIARGSHHVMAADGAPASIPIGIRNDSPDSRVATLIADPPDGLTLAGEVPVAARGRASTEVIVDPKSISGTREFELRIRNTEAVPYRLKITVVRATPTDASVARGSLLIP